MYHQNIHGLSTNYKCLGEILDSHQGMGIISLSETTRAMKNILQSRVLITLLEVE